MEEPTEQPYSILVNSNPRHKRIQRIEQLGKIECSIGGCSILVAVIANVIVAKLNSDYSNNRTDYGFIIDPKLTYTSQGMWSGVMIFITGILGMHVRNNPSEKIYIANMVLIAITVATSLSGIVLSGFAAAMSIYSLTLTFLHLVIAGLIIVGVIASIIHSIFCFRGLVRINVSKEIKVTKDPQLYTSHPQQTEFTC